MRRLLSVILFLMFSVSLHAYDIKNFEKVYMKIKSKSKLQDRRKAFDAFYENLTKAKAPNDPVKFLAFASMKDVFHGTKASSLNANRCRGLYQKMEEGYYPRRGVASAPRYLYPTIAFVDLICKN